MVIRPSPNIIFFSRSETASLLQLLLEDILDEQKFSVYEIEYFEKENAIRFIKSILKHKADSNITKHNEPFQNVCDIIFSVIGKGIDSECEDIWGSEEIRSFIGYSPVLQTIAEYLYEQNYQEIIERFSKNDSQKTGLGLISNFIESLLEREQHKFIDGLKVKIGEIPNLIIGWDNIFTAKKQLLILIKYIISDSSGIQKMSFPEVPDLIKQAYYDSLIQFIPNHPFLRSHQFSSPAFRDYALALLLKENHACDNCTKYLDNHAIVLTPLFAYFYAQFSDNTCIGNHVGYIYESVISRQGLDENIILTYLKNENGNYILEMINTGTEKSNPFVFDCKINDTYPLVIERRLKHAIINIEHEVILGRAGSSLELSDIELKTKKLVLKSKECVINTHNEEDVYIEAKEFKQEDYSLSIKKHGEGSLKVFWPESKSYPWADYSLDSPIEFSEEFAESLYDLKRILIPFRKHGRKEFAKHADFIDKVIVNGSSERRKLLDYLIHIKIIQKNIATSQYTMDTDTLNKYGFNWSDVKGMSNNAEVIKFITEFNNF